MSGASADSARWASPGISLRRDRSPVAPNSTMTCGGQRGLAEVARPGAGRRIGDRLCGRVGSGTGEMLAPRMVRIKAVPRGPCAVARNVTVAWPGWAQCCGDVQLSPSYPDLASRDLAGSVDRRQRRAVRAAAELDHAACRAVHAADEFGHTGKVYDGWETRRRREPGHGLGRSSGWGCPASCTAWWWTPPSSRGTTRRTSRSRATSVEGYPEAGGAGRTCQLGDAGAEVSRPRATPRTSIRCDHPGRLDPRPPDACIPTAVWPGSGCTGRWCWIRGSSPARWT